MSDDPSPAAGALPPFHLAFPVHCVESARRFYGDLLGCGEGRSAEHWVDFNFFGHQIVAHFCERTAEAVASREEAEAGGEDPAGNPVDGHLVPVPHFGAVLPWQQWEQLAERLRAAQVPFVIEPYIRFRGEVGEQATMFFRDPSGNALEFKAFRDPSQLFAK
ncbi:MAG: VOC family protein [Planctomycetales bacterium]|nr:VOC family protein [Planctomycetales bacterium]